MKYFNVDKCKLVANKHFKNTWMRKWDWDYHDLREAIRNTYKTKKIGKTKFEIYVRKKGEKKIIVIYYIEFDTIFIITGSEG